MTFNNKKTYLALAAAILLGLSPMAYAAEYAESNAAPTTKQAKDKVVEEEDIVDIEEDDEDGDDEDDEDDEEDDEDDDATDNNGQSASKTSAGNQYADEEIIITDKNGSEEIIEVPEGMYSDLDSLLDDYNAKAYLERDTNCHMQDVNPVYDQEVYVDRLKRMPTAMEMPWNEVVQKFIDRYSGRLRHSVSYMLGASNLYMPIFEEALEVYGIPLELKYLPVIESALNPKATSRVGAGGLWQFMTATAKRYGLKVNSMIDERRDPTKASYAAAHYLYDLYQIFGDWNLVLAAYNYGPGNIKKAIQRAGGEKDYWKIYPYLPTETRGYVPAFIAANYIMTYYCEHNICPMTTRLPEQTDTIMLYRNVHFEQIAKVLDIDINELRSLNPQYRRDVVTGYSEPTDLRLPQEYISKFIEMEDSIYNYNVDALMKRDMVDVDQSHAYKSSSSRSYSNKKYSRSYRNKLLKSKKSKASKKKKSSKKSKKSSKKKNNSSKKKSSKKSKSSKKRRRR